MGSAHYSRMGEQEYKKIHMATLGILERTGVDVHDKAARNLLVEGGAVANTSPGNSGQLFRPFEPSPA